MCAIRRGCGLDSQGWQQRRRRVEHISRDDLKAKMDRGDDFVLVDTMPKMYYRHSHLPGAINLPADEVRERASELLPDKDAEIVVYCIDPP
ncbi:MAG TPA: rhodanese-like domain-containing protein [Rubrobacteraceae bacterium]|nr:rhodanese-like domain-containing protein [Rubrobacteraceae bacterium]